MAKEKKSLTEFLTGHSDKDRIQVTERGTLQQRFREATEKFMHGPERTKGQRLTNKLTRGHYYGKKWFPY